MKSLIGIKSEALLAGKYMVSSKRVNCGREKADHVGTPTEFAPVDWLL